MDRIFAKIIRLLLHVMPIKSRRTRVVVINGDKVLLILNRMDIDGYYWTLPGGGCKRGESSEACAVRELEEEVGITVDQKDLKKLDVLYYSKVGLFRSDFDVFRVYTDETDIKMDKRELLNAQWFDRNKLPDNIKEVVARLIKSDKL